MLVSRGGRGAEMQSLGGGVAEEGVLEEASDGGIMGVGTGLTAEEDT